MVSEPFEGVSSALVIVGSDKRGTIYGAYDLSEQIGVSPWYWWADVPVKKSDVLFIKPGKYITPEPAVKYRGIFINDEEPCLGRWAREKFGGINSKMYSHMFELILRLRGNYLWPAMWGKSIFEDDPESARLADEYGIVLGTSHHEPMNRAHVDWTRSRQNYGNGKWNYAKNEDGLKRFWTEGIQRNKDYETLITVGMRGDGDGPMIEGGDIKANIALLEKIISDQRNIIAEQMNLNPVEVPQMWALYKEVKDYYDHGMTVPDDITLLWCDDNWGNIRRLPTEQERKRSGGAGIYYHVDYVGTPRSYKWLNVSPLPKIWEQMNMAYKYGIDRIWIVNVGDLKPMEVPIEFFLQMAWDPKAMPKEKISEFTNDWARREFGSEYSSEIADIVSKYAKYNAWRKPELLEPDTFSLVNYNEAETVLSKWKNIAAEAEKINKQLDAEYRDAFYQLVLYPAKASANIVEMYIETGKNHLYSAQGRASTNQHAKRVKQLFDLDQQLSDAYHKIAGGKWNHMMSQTRIGYTNWDDPDVNIMPKVTKLEVSDKPLMALAIEGSDQAYSDDSQIGQLPDFDSISQQSRWIDIFNMGNENFDFTISVNSSWVIVSDVAGNIGNDKRVWVSIDWDKVPEGQNHALVTVTQNKGQSLSVKLNAVRSYKYTSDNVNAYGGLTGPVSIAAESMTNNIPAGNVRWGKIPDYGRGPSGMAVFPVTADSVLPPKNSPCMEYSVFISKAGEIQVDLITGISLKTQPDGGVRIAVSLDNQAPQILDAFKGQSYEDPSKRGDPSSPAIRDWHQWVKDNVRTLKSKHHVSEKGVHTLKVWMVDPGVVLEKIVLHDGSLPKSYFGPPESKFSSDCKKSQKPQASYVTGQYRNLFAEAGYSPELVKKK